MTSASHSGGVKPMSLQGRLYRERERLIGMTDEERAWRKQWIRDQVLAHNEPKHVPELQKQLHNPLRRFYRYPLDTVFKALEPSLGYTTSHIARHITGKTLMILTFFYAGAYYVKYNLNDWTRKGGWRSVPNRKAVVPGDPDFPFHSTRKVGADYAPRGFKESPI